MMALTKNCGCGCRKIAVKPGKVSKRKGKRVYKWAIQVESGEVEQHTFEPGD